MSTPPDIHEALKYHFGFGKFKGDQQAIIESLLDGNDVLCLCRQVEASLSAISCPR